MSDKLRMRIIDIPDDMELSELPEDAELILDDREEDDDEFWEQFN